jgi:hypothetical protein
MSRVSVAKIAIAAAGIVLFFVGVRLEMYWLRWTGIGFVLVAWLLRFVERGSRRGPRRDHSA